MLNKYQLYFIFILTLAVSGCSIYRISSEDTSSNFYASKASVNDVVYVEKISQPHENIGHVTITTERRQTLQNVIDQMKREAAILGADAITNIQSDATGTWRELPVQTLLANGYVRANFTATAVVFK